VIRGSVHSDRRSTARRAKQGEDGLLTRHELSLCAAPADIVNRRTPGRSVAKIHVCIGQLRQVVPDTLVYCSSMVTTDTSLADAELLVEKVAARLLCETCGVESALDTVPVFACTACGGTSVSVVAGDEFLITGIETVESAGRNT
jgi:hydrogenase nickel incorporation protein HypA/HybF